MIGDKLYECKNCGKIIGVIQDSSAKLFCCGQPMQKVAGGKKEQKGQKNSFYSHAEENTLCPSGR